MSQHALAAQMTESLQASATRHYPKGSGKGGQFMPSAGKSALQSQRKLEQTPAHKNAFGGQGVTPARAWQYGSHMKTRQPMGKTSAHGARGKLLGPNDAGNVTNMQRARFLARKNASMTRIEKARMDPSSPLHVSSPKTHAAMQSAGYSKGVDAFHGQSTDFKKTAGGLHITARDTKTGIELSAPGASTPAHAKVIKSELSSISKATGRPARFASMGGDAKVIAKDHAFAGKNGISTRPKKLGLSPATKAAYAKSIDRGMKPRTGKSPGR